MAQEAGIDFRHESGRTGALRLPEIIGAGVAILDFDGDGRMDVYLVQGGPLPGAKTGGKPSDRLYRNVGKLGELRFEDVTAETGLKPGDYGMGVATGDIDNDGDTDLFRTALGRNRLLMNEG
ncbi:MAG: VCBS repeat-containing protein, partial [Gammaproteobacteria bacterium]|nr:VCBS repeat-containing protein [Gammaproteobacteria bacterium]